MSPSAPLHLSRVTDSSVTLSISKPPGRSIDLTFVKATRARSIATKKASFPLIVVFMIALWVCLKKLIDCLSVVRVKVKGRARWSARKMNRRPALTRAEGRFGQRGLIDKCKLEPKAEPESQQILSRR
mmetsp:Transcript_9547/g.17916  ORF Transcript_9547/g.17916 Transcript_9547/m.17916 type:complete len:128 (+) Transcript_9547:2940-3323(+)